MRNLTVTRKDVVFDKHAPEFLRPIDAYTVSDDEGIVGEIRVIPLKNSGQFNIRAVYRGNGVSFKNLSTEPNDAIVEAFAHDVFNSYMFIAG